MKKLSFEDYSGWVSRELEKSLRPTESRARRLVEDSRRVVVDAERFFQDLSRKAERDMGTKRDPVSYRAARLVGHSAKEAAGSLSRIQPPVGASWDSIKAFRDSVSGASRSLRDLRSRAAGELAGLYILDMRSFAGVNERVAKANERLTSFLEGEGSSLLKTRTLNAILADVQNVRKELVEKEDEERRLTEEIGVLSVTVDSLLAEMNRAVGDPLLSEVLGIERELRKESLDFRTVTLAHLQRPLRRLRDLAERGEVPLGSEERQALARFTELPYRSFLSMKTGEYLNNILRSLKRALEDGKIGFKPRKAARVLAQLDQLIGSGGLDARQKQGRDLLLRRRSLLRREDCKALYDSRKGTLMKLEEARKTKQLLAERGQALRERSESLRGRVGELLALAELKTREFVGREVQIERPVPSAGS